MKFDCELAAKDVQDLASADAIAGLFAKLGYHTDARTEQTPGNLGITAEGTARPIERIELIADQEGLLQVYLFEVKSVTITHTRALARAFRNRAGNYLLVLTSDYERLDFVLVEKYLPSAAAEAKTIGQRQVAVRPRMLTVERRKPARVHLRVLRRFTYTEADPLAQYDKLLSAYTIAEWSEEFFNNRALFSDYYLLERLRERAEWGEDPKPAYVRLRELYQEAASHFAGGPEEQLRSDLLEPVFESLGFAFKRGKQAKSDATEPDYRLVSPESKNGTLAACLTYPWGRSLDGKDAERDKETPDENPNFVVVSLLERGEAPWAVVTNGKAWRLYSARAHAKATNYYEVDLEEVLAAAGPHAGGPADAFRYFWLLFRREALEPTTVVREGKEQTLCFLDLLLAESEDYAKELGERLKERVFVEIFPHVAEGFVAYIHDKEGKDAELTQERLDNIFQGTLTLLYRLLFLLYAESRDLLPVRETRGYFEISLSRLKQEIAEAAGTIADEVDGKLKRHYRNESYELYDRLMRLFEAVDQGDASVNVPFYNGGLFITQPGGNDEMPEAANARFLNAHKVLDRHLARAIDLMARDPDPKRQDLVFLDYKSLGVRHLGSIYEGLLEFKVRIADRKLGVKKEKGREVYVSFRDLTDRQKTRAEREGKVVPKGHAYLENDKRERKATGSYYTPDYIVEYIVEHTVGPVLAEKFEAARPLLREAQQKRQAFFKEQAALGKKGLPTKNEAQADLKGRDEVIRQLFDIKVLDPAMGSGHFLVEAVDVITDKMLDFLNAFPWNPVRAHLEETREAILEDVERQGVSIDRAKLTDVNLLKRYILKRCIYGVDLNPMAVELAKVSLWLDCFTLGAPLSFLDHHIRCGNSLIGVTVDEVKEAVGQVLWGDQFTGVMLATDLMRHVGELSDVTSAQVQESRREYRKAVDALAPFKRILDVYTSRWFGNEPQKAGRRKGGAGFDPAIEFLATSECVAWAKKPGETKDLTDWDKKVVERTLAAAEQKRFFHWELEFPEVFYGPSEVSEQRIERLKEAGFDAAVGNPPYAGHKGDFDAAPLVLFFEVCKDYPNYATAFCEKAIAVLSQQGKYGLIVPKSIQYVEAWSAARALLACQHRLERLADVSKAFEDVLLEQTVVIGSKASPDTQYCAAVLDGEGSAIELMYPIQLLRDLESLPAALERESLSLLQHLLSIGTRLRDVSYTCQALGYQAKINRPAGGAKIPIFRGRHIRPMRIDETEDWIDKSFLLAANSDSVTKKVQAMMCPKVVSQNIVAHVTNPKPRVWIISSPDLRGVVCLNTVSTTAIKDTRFPPEYLAAVLNSSLASWFCYEFVFCRAVRTMHLDNYYIGKLPVPVPDAKTVRRSRLLHRKCEGDMARSIRQKMIDEVVFDAYRLSEAQRHFVYQYCYGTTDLDLALQGGNTQF